MPAMNESWAAVITGIVGAAAGIGGTLLGMLVSRHQTTGQAHVEHRQWLRGHRQQAYLDLLEGWDAEVQVLMAIQLRWDGQLTEWRESGEVGVHPIVQASDNLQASWARLRRLIERVDLLGPRPAHEALRKLEDAFVGMRGLISGQDQDGHPGWVDIEEWDRALSRAAACRTVFLLSAAEVLRTPPGPEGEADNR